MKKIFLLLLLLSNLFFVISCKKEVNEEPKKEDPIKEEPFNPSITDELFNTISTDDFSKLLVADEYEFGYEFSSKVNGLITHLGHNMPEIGAYIVTLWDVESNQPMARTTIKRETEVDSINSWVYRELTYTVALKANTKYRISVNNISQDDNNAKAYYRTKSGIVNFGVETLNLGNDFTIDNGVYAVGNTYPKFKHNYLSGLPTFAFLPGLLDNSLSKYYSDIMPCETTLINVGNEVNIGYEFSVNSNGKITHLGYCLPEKGVYTVSVWEKDVTQAPIAEVDVEQIGDGNSLNCWIYGELSEPVNIEAGKQYYALVYLKNGSVDFYISQDNPNCEFDMEANPLQVGEITISQGVFTSDGYVYPDVFVLDRIYGYPGLIFQKD